MKRYELHIAPNQSLFVSSCARMRGNVVEIRSYCNHLTLGLMRTSAEVRCRLDRVFPDLRRSPLRKELLSAIRGPYE